MSRFFALTLAALAFLASHARAEEATVQDAKGWLYGTVKTDSGKEYTGRLRWDTEEAFWDDLFHGAKADESLRYLRKYEDEDRDKDRRSRITVFGVTVGYRWDESDAEGRFFAVRFGDLREIEPQGEEEAKITLKNGSVVEIEGGSNDVGGPVRVHDRSIGDVELAWDKIERITFAAAPSSLELPAWRLHGTTKAAGQTFEGYVQWDKQESWSTDKLDGESEDGTLAIEMGQIRSIERRSSTSSRVVLRDGREYVLRGTNDVNEENRGIAVEDERYGRVEIPWDAFESVEFRKVASSGRGYADYRATSELRGTLTRRDGTVQRGKLVIDLDESDGSEMLDGSRDGIAYAVPFERIRSIEPDRWDSSRVVLRGGIELLLEEGQDVAEVNAGVVVIDGGQDGNAGKADQFVPWQEVRRIELD